MSSREDWKWLKYRLKMELRTQTSAKILHWLEQLDDKKWKEAFKNPRLAAQFIGESHPVIGHRVFNQLAEFFEPHLVGSGITVEQLDNENIRILCPFRWKNKASHGEISSGVLTSLGEFAIQSFLERHINFSGIQIQFQEFNLKIIDPLKEDVVVKFGLPSSELEKLIYELGVNGQAEPLLMVSFLNKNEQLKASLETQLRIVSPLALESRSKSPS